MTEQEVIQVSGMLASCAGVVVFILGAILGCLLETKLNWFKW